MKVVFIAGSGRTGSTLLSLLLSQSPEVFNAGQIRDLPLAHRTEATCSCAAPLRECPHWGAVIDRAYGDDPSGGLAAAAYTFTAFRDAVDPVVLWSDAREMQSAASYHRGLLDDLRARYAACAEVAGVTTLVDSSKSPELAAALSMLPEIDLHVLNLVRDPRAVACSWMGKYGDRTRVARRCRAWKDRQLQLAAFAEARPERFKMLRYEDFVARPRTTIAEILNWAGLPESLGFFTAEDRATLSWEHQHLFPPTNERMLAERPREVHIAPRESWRTLSNLRTRLLATRLTFPLNLRHGYGLL